MNYNEFGQTIVSTDDLFDLLYTNPNLDLSKFLVRDPDTFNNSVNLTYCNITKLTPFIKINKTIQEFDHDLQSDWKMPGEYLNLDIASWLLNQCKSTIETSRVNEELILYAERNLFNLLRYLKYAVDTFRKNNIVWGVGRGSSVASYSLYLLGVHKIDSVKYNLDINEFLK